MKKKMNFFNFKENCCHLPN